MKLPVRANRAFAISAAIAASLALTGCGAQETDPENTAAAAAVVEAGPVSVTDPWIKAVDIDQTDHKMTGAFGTIKNDTDAEVTIVGAKAEIAGMVELHETVVEADGSSMMQEVDGGFKIPAGAMLELKPGDNHIMLMHLHKSIMPGDEVKVTLEFADGTTADVTFEAKEYTGGKETYAPDGSMGNNPHGGMDHSGHGDMDHGDHDGQGDHDGHGEMGEETSH
ncbi:copper chaperone PCu(A)C [uncultured Gulosibacter sp.]|uniref:copper chaperone PCu(A)C n=1 Tax=uncultured Gulosibacter sp. TaxID=1339167 RepID=UPI002889A151|nr:copper chaperone PCu(A)C [uncultured Gulosibacter sp.]